MKSNGLSIPHWDIPVQYSEEQSVSVSGRAANGDVCWYRLFDTRAPRARPAPLSDDRNDMYYVCARIDSIEDRKGETPQQPTPMGRSDFMSQIRIVGQQQNSVIQLADESNA